MNEYAPKFGQFLFLYFLGHNVDYVTFKKVLEALADQKTSEIYPSVPLVLPSVRNGYNSLKEEAF